MAMRSNWLLVPAAIVAAAPFAYSTEYFSIAEAQKAIFPGADRFEPLSVQLSKEQMKDIQKASGVSVRSGKVKVWNALAGQKVLGTFWMDQVVGKHEFITYGLGIGIHGKVTQVEIMDYRETYGYQVREARWRKNFVGKKIGVRR